MTKIIIVLIILLAFFIYGCSENTVPSVSIPTSSCVMNINENGSTVNTQDNNAVGSPELTHKINEENIFEMLPSKFGFSSGAGSWYTIITLNDDGTFEGQYIDSDMGSAGIGYSDRVYKCNFVGKFSAPERVNEYLYSTELKDLKVEESPGTEYIENDTLYIWTKPYGFDNAESFLIYLPGCPLSEVSEDFISWTLINPEIRTSIPAAVYGLYNVGGREGFVGIGEDNLWLKDFIYDYNSCKSELHPSYSSMSRLIFWTEAGEPILELTFNWSEDKQMEFVALDSNGTGEYLISFDFSKDFDSVIATIESSSGHSLTPWGGSSEGFLQAEYRIKQ